MSPIVKKSLFPIDVQLVRILNKNLIQYRIMLYAALSSGTEFTTQTTGLEWIGVLEPLFYRGSCDPEANDGEFRQVHSFNLVVLYRKTVKS